MERSHSIFCTKSSQNRHNYCCCTVCSLVGLNTSIQEKRMKFTILHSHLIFSFVYWYNRQVLLLLMIYMYGASTVGVYVPVREQFENRSAKKNKESREIALWKPSAQHATKPKTTGKQHSSTESQNSSHRDHRRVGSASSTDGGVGLSGGALGQSLSPVTEQTTVGPGCSHTFSKPSPGACLCVIPCFYVRSPCFARVCSRWYSVFRSLVIFRLFSECPQQSTYLQI